MSICGRRDLGGDVVINVILEWRGRKRVLGRREGAAGQKVMGDVVGCS